MKRASPLRIAFFPLLLPAVCVIPYVKSDANRHITYGETNTRLRDRDMDSPGPTATSTATATATATHTPTPCNQYWTTSGTLPIVTGTTDTGNHCDNCDTAVTLPFPFRLYGVTYSTVMVSSNGRLDFLCNNEPAGFGGSVCRQGPATARLTTPSSRIGRILGPT